MYHRVIRKIYIFLLMGLLGTQIQMLSKDRSVYEWVMPVDV